MATATNAHTHDGKTESDEEREDHEERRENQTSGTEPTSREAGLLLEASYARNAELKREIDLATDKLSNARGQITWLEQRLQAEQTAETTAGRQRAADEREIAQLKRSLGSRVAKWRRTQENFATLEKENRKLDTRMERWMADYMRDRQQRDTERREAQDVRFELEHYKAQYNKVRETLSPEDADLHAEITAANRRADFYQRQLARATAEDGPGPGSDTQAYPEGTAAHRERAQLIERIRVMNAKAHTDADQIDMFFAQYTSRHWPEKDRVFRCADQAARLFSSEQKAVDLQDRLDTLRRSVKAAAAAAGSEEDTGATGSSATMAPAPSANGGQQKSATLRQARRPLIGKSYADVISFDLAKFDDDMPRWDAEITAELDSLGVAADQRGNGTVAAAAAAAETTWPQEFQGEGLTVHRGDHGCPPEIISLLGNAARDYLPKKVDKLFNLRPVWRRNKKCVLLPHQVEDKDKGCREIGKKAAPEGVKHQVWQMLRRVLPAHNGRQLGEYDGRALKPLFRHRGCPAQPCHRDGEHGLSVIIPLTKDYVIYFHPWRRASDYREAGTAMMAQVNKTRTDQIAGPPTMITANPGDVIIFDKRIAHFGGPARDQAGRQPDSVDTAWPSTDSKRPITDVAWHVHLDDPFKGEDLLSDGTDSVYYVHSPGSEKDEERAKGWSDDDEDKKVRKRPAGNDGESAPVHPPHNRPRGRPKQTERHIPRLGRPDGSGQGAPPTAEPSAIRKGGPPRAAAASGAPAGSSTDDVRARDEREGEGGTSGHLGPTKASGETDDEYVRRTGQYEAWEDKKWRERVSAATEAKNDRLAAQWDEEDAAGVGNRIRSRKRGRR